MVQATTCKSQEFDIGTRHFTKRTKINLYCKFCFMHFINFINLIFLHELQQPKLKNLYFYLQPNSTHQINNILLIHSILSTVLLKPDRSYLYIFTTHTSLNHNQSNAKFDGMVETSMTLSTSVVYNIWGLGTFNFLKSKAIAQCQSAIFAQFGWC